MDIKISPSILSADFSNLKEEIKKVVDAEYLHLDVMDMQFVPNLTFGAKLIKDLRPHTKQIFDTHLMVNNPENYVDMMADAGVDILTIHLESCIHSDRLVKYIKSKGMKVGITLVPSTPEENLKYLINEVDLVLVMTVNPGFGGQSFIHSQLNKIKNIKKMIDESGRNIELEVDGGINLETSKLAKEVGANVLVAGSYIFNSNNPATAIKSLR